MATQKNFGLNLLRCSLVESFGHNVSTYSATTDIKKNIFEAGPFDLILFDCDMMAHNSTHEIIEIVKANQGRPVVIHSDKPSVEILNNLTSCGIRGFLPKSAPKRLAITGIDFLLDGGFFFHQK